MLPWAAEKAKLLIYYESGGGEDKASLQSEQNLHASPVQWTMWPMQHKQSKQLSKY